MLLSIAILLALVSSAWTKLIRNECGEYRTLNPVDCLEPSSGNATAVLFFLHGSGEFGPLLRFRLQYLLGNKARFSQTRIIFPTAPLTSYSPLRGMTIPTWYDISGFTINATENDSEIHSVATNLETLVKDQIKKGIPLNRMVFAGHSRGGAMAMHMAFTSLKQMAGVATVGSFLPITSTLFQDLCNSKDYLRDIPILLQLHGSADRLVTKHIGIETFRNLVSCGIHGIFRSYYKVGHLLTKSEIKHLYSFVNLLLPPI